jgi:glutamate/tyrosine decarboxylase-like PLP-dependent enzyme
MIKTLGRRGIEQLVDRHCRIAGDIARILAEEPGVEILNDVVLNQVVVRFGGDADGDQMTTDVIDAVQANGECFVAGARWHERWVMRISVICGATTTQEAERSCTAILEAWRQVKTRSA